MTAVRKIWLGTLLILIGAVSLVIAPNPSTWVLLWMLFFVNVCFSTASCYWGGFSDGIKEERERWKKWM